MGSCLMSAQVSEAAQGAKSVSKQTNVRTFLSPFSIVQVAEFELSADQAASYPQLSLVMRGKNKGRGQHSGVEGHDACDGGHSHGPHDTQRQCGGGDAADHHMCGLAASRANLKV